MIYIRKADGKDLVKIVTLSERISADLEERGQAYLFGGADRYEILMAMQAPSVVIIAEEGDRVLGFLLLQQPSAKEEEAFVEEFPNNYKPGEGIVANGIGVDPTRKKLGIAKLMMKMAKKYALGHGFTKFIGTVHPDNIASQKSLASTGEFLKGRYFTLKTRDGRDLLRQRFIQDLT